MKQIISAIIHPLTGLVLLLIPTIVVWIMVFASFAESDRLPYHASTDLVWPTTVSVATSNREPLVSLAPVPTTAPRAILLLPTITAIPTDTPVSQPTVTPWPTMAPLPTPTLLMLPTLSPLLYPTAIIWPTDTPLPQIVVLLPMDTPTPWPTDTLFPVSMIVQSTPVLLETLAPGTLPIVPPANISIVSIYYDGQVPRVESDEYAEIANNSAVSIDIGGWRLYAGDKGQNFIFPTFNLAPGQSVRCLYQ